jgi:hypothetical protein
VPVLIYPKPDHEPAVFTVLNLQVRDVDEAVDSLIDAGITMEHYEGGERDQDRRQGHRARRQRRRRGHRWFRDPSGNIVSVLES